uniref:Integrase n=1 Tax=Mycena chlorophos TaxID=658473 RepID=A0ABQ0LKW2_MYCCL|nr:predicted protein [Mycena chlorophos]
MFARRRRINTYRTREEQDAYWTAAERFGCRLRSSDARRCLAPNFAPYIPALLPVYRKRIRTKNGGSEYHLPLRTICKWHRMVFEGPWHPTIPQAARMREHLSIAAKREIHRIARMLPDERVFGVRAQGWTPRYRRIWRKWLEKSRDELGVFFES